ncbi:cache domain-containing protein [Pseudomonas sp. D(2018)]|uniref:cache domain-containing protein n=1 Tax=Pseudomonas sp. D(2018) TaxID=2502238 RepID=UPI0010F606D0|nr:cache domain-containing protein [Pseudomonas sp. D(2018)]
MWSIFRDVLLLLFGLASLSSAFAQSDKDYAQETERATRLLNKAVALYRIKGSAALADFSRQGGFVDGEMYVYVVDTNGVMLASGGPSVILVGRNVSSVLDGELDRAFKEALSVPEDGKVRSAEYRWLNWNDGKTERKRVFYQRVGEKVFAAGYYMPRSSKSAAVDLLGRASAAIAADAQKTIERINALDADFIRDDLYVFVVDLDTQKFSAHGVNLRLVGTDFRALQSADQQPIGMQMLDVLKSNEVGEVAYTWRNPANGRIEQKSTLLRKVGKYAVAVGYYLGPST